MKVTIKDVAERAGVSTATVSRVLNGNSVVDPDTAAKVRQVIEEMEYYPDAVARSMRRNRSNSIGFAIEDISNAHFTIMARSIEDQIHQKSYSLLVSSSVGKAEDESRYLRIFLSKKMDGLIIHSTGHNDALIAELSRQIPTVLVYRKVRDPGFEGDFVGSEDFDGGYRLAKHVFARRHRRIGVINGAPNISTGSERLEGFLAALREEGLSLDESMIFYGEDYLRETGELGAKAFMRLRKPPTALVALSNNIALGVLEYLHGEGYAIPHDVSFASFGEISNSSLFFVQPTVVRQSPASIGEIAGRFLLQRIANNSLPQRVKLISSYLVEGNSVAML